MSYNKLKSLVANVEAIETAMKIQVQGRQATAEEKEILSRYSGFGGIKEVLNIGTDKPIGGDMQEPIQRLQELINAYPHFTEPMRHNVIEGIKASVLTAFYTPKFLVDAVVRQIHATFSENGLKMRSFLEPSAGIGGFLPIAMSGTYDYAIEKDLISGMILSLLHENTLTRTAAFETIGEQGFEHTTFDVIAVDDYSHGNSITTWVRVRSKKENHIRLSEYLTKGRLLLIEGTLSASLWKDKDENCQIQLSITADTLEFINTGKREAATSEAGSPTDATSDVPVPPVAMPQEEKEDLPF